LTVKNFAPKPIIKTRAEGGKRPKAAVLPSLTSRHTTLRQKKFHDRHVEKQKMVLHYKRWIGNRRTVRGRRKDGTAKIIIIYPIYHIFIRIIGQRTYTFTRLSYSRTTAKKELLEE